MPTGKRIQPTKPKISLNTCTKTVKKITTVVAAMKSFFLWKSGSKTTKEKQMAPLRPPYAIMNWSLRVTVLMCNLLMMKVRTRTPKRDKARQSVLKR